MKPSSGAGSHDDEWWFSNIHGRFWTTERLIKLMIFALVVVIIITGVMISSLQDVKAAQDNLEKGLQMDAQRTFINRAQSCQVQVLLGAPVDSECLDPKVVRHYQVDVSPTAGDGSESQKRNRILLCSILQRLEVVHSECQQSDE